MSNIWYDGFDHYTTLTDFWGLVSSGTTQAIAVSGARTGSNCLTLKGSSGNDAAIRRVIPAALEHATVILGFGFKRDQSSPNQPFYITLCSDAGATQHLSLVFDNGGTVTLRRGAYNGTVLATSGAIAPPVNTYNYYELKATLSATVGYYELRMNGSATPIFSASNQNTKNGGTKTTFDSVLLNAQVNNFGPNTTYYLDDMYLNNGAGSVNNDFEGDIAVRYFVPNAAGTYKEFTGVGDAANNWANVDESPPSMGDYNYTASNEQRDTFNVADVVGTGKIVGVSRVLYAQKSDTGAKGIAGLVRSGTTDSEGADTALSTSAQWYTEAVPLDPATSALWTISGFNAAEWGYKSKAS